MSNFFLSKFDKEWVGYANYRDLEWWKSETEQLNSLWPRWEPFADSNFQTSCRKSEETFNQRIFEMKLGVELLYKGHDISSKNVGPDICINNGNQKIWIEAVAPERGDIPNTVPENPRQKLHCEETGMLNSIDFVEVTGIEYKIMLRYSSVIGGKHKKLIEYLNKGTVGGNDPLIIAISSANFATEEKTNPGNYPNIVKLCFAIGDTSSFFDPSKQEIRHHLSHRDKILKLKADSGPVTIDSDIFLRPVYPELSAIIFSYGKLGMYSPSKKEKEFIVIHNPFAENPVKRGFLGIGREYYLENIEYSDGGKSICGFDLKCQELHD